MNGVYPLESLTLEEAKQRQFRWVDALSRHLTGEQTLQQGELGLQHPYHKPLTTRRVEDAIADFFGQERALLVRGAGTGALREAIYAVVPKKKKLLVHDAPLYPTTERSLQMLGIDYEKVDFHDMQAVMSVLSNVMIGAVLIQHTRQKMDDAYDPILLCRRIKEEYPLLPVVFDDNYAVLKVPKIGVESGADLSCFSCFKLLGPEGIGCLVGKSEFIESIEAGQYSGGGQVQGHEAMAVARGLTYAPVALALQAEVNEVLLDRLNTGKMKGVEKAWIANAQSKVLLVQLEEDNADAVLQAAERLGAAPRPVGAESKYEILPMFYRVSGTFRAADPNLANRMIRINPMRAGAETVLRILRTAIEEALCS